MMKKIFVILFLMWTAFPVLSAENSATSRPNILFIMADDCTYSEIGCFGGQNAKTPNIDKLADEGLIFNRAYVSMAMCVPARHELYTGLYPMESGCAWNHGRSKPGTKSIFHYLTDLGYRVGISGKKHASPKEVFPYINVPGFEENCVLANEEKEDITGIKRFMEEKNDEPFCLFVCSTSPHAPWTLGDASAYPPAELKLPAHLGDTPEVREAYSRYLAEVTYFDRQVGEVLKTLEETGNANNTVVMLSTEQGWQFSGGKWTNWDLGVHTGLIAKWPGKIKPGSETGALVQFADITPTFVDVAGGEEVPAVSGKSFLDVLLGKNEKHRKYVYCMHNNVPEGKPYPIRAVISSEYHYISNLLPDSIYFEKHLEAGAHGEVWWERWKEKANTSTREKYLVERFYHRPAEEFYAVETDKEQFDNLAGNPIFERELEKHQNALDAWMKTQNDPGVPVDTESEYEKRYWEN
ncbi:sulfatase family protein [Tangfeifania diversioriginum]|nr:sulfatase [Tangfeifania diversioriginum]